MLLTLNDLTIAPDSPRSQLWRDSKGKQLPPELWLNEADRVAEMLAEMAPSDSLASLHWPGVRPETTLDLFAGSSGVAFFLAAHAWLRDNQRSHALAMATIEENLKSLRQNGFDHQELTGGLVGPAAFAWTLAHTSAWLQRPDWLDQAAEILIRAQPPDGSDSKPIDVVEGIAGVLLVTLDVHEMLDVKNPRHKSTMELAELCGDYLVSRQTAIEGRGRAWLSTVRNCPLSGFAHGASGIATALARLHSISPKTSLFQAVVRALDFEDTLFLEEFGNWVVAPDDSIRPYGWCYGAPGIALARQELKSASGMDTLHSRLVRDRDVALRTCWTAPKDPFDHICCGLASRVMALIRTSHHESSSVHREAAEVIAYFILRATRHKGQFRIPEPGYSASLLHGVSGIGLAFLSLGTSEQLPCPLTLSA